MAAEREKDPDLVSTTVRIIVVDGFCACPSAAFRSGWYLAG